MGAGCPAGLAVENAARPCSRCAEPGSPLKMMPRRAHGVLGCFRRMTPVCFFHFDIAFCFICGVVCSSFFHIDNRGCRDFFVCIFGVSFSFFSARPFMNSFWGE